MPKTDGILESTLYVGDMEPSVQFYQRIFGFRVISDLGGRQADGFQEAGRTCEAQATALGSGSGGYRPGNQEALVA